MKKMLGTKKIQNTLNFCVKPDSCKKNHFLAILEPSTWNWKNSFFQKIWFFFQAQILQALKNYLFFKNWNVQYLSFYPLFLSSKNLYKWLLKLNFCGVAFWCKTPQNRPNPATKLLSWNDQNIFNTTSKRTFFWRVVNFFFHENVIFTYKICIQLADLNHKVLTS